MSNLCRKVLIQILLVSLPLAMAAAQQIAPTPLKDEQQANGEQQAAAELARWRASRVGLLNDWGELSRYRAANQLLLAGPPDAERVVFFGDSITDAWNLDDYFPGKHYVNRGIGGQTTPQMLVRFRQDVLDLHPRVVIILAGTNDLAGNTGPMSLQDTEANFASMAELASAHDIRVVFSSVLPVHNYTRAARSFFALRSPEKILELNRWLKSYCESKGHIYLDYFSSMVDEKGLLKRELADDGLHPNDAGYHVMAPLAAAAIKSALSPPPER